MNLEERDMEEVNVKNKVEKNNMICKELTKVFWVFIIGSVIGYILEMIVGILQNGHFVSRQGLLFGPFIQVYGLGLTTYYLVISKSKNMSNLKIFILSMILGGVIEYLFSYFQEKLFGTISWDYSNLPFNLNGRTSLLHCLYWGTGGVLFVKLILPYIDKLDNFYKYKTYKVTTALLVLFICFDITISGLAGIRYLERRKNMEAKNDIDVFFDVNYPDSKLKEIYSNAKEVKIDEL